MCYSGIQNTYRVLFRVVVLHCPRGYLAMSGDIKVATTGGAATAVKWVKTKDIAKHPTIQRTAPHNKESTGPNNWSWETPI